MTRDMELIRKILLEVEKFSQPIGWATLNVPGYDPEVVSYHVMILNQAGYLEAQDLTTHERFFWAPTSLTWQGHEFLDAIRNETVWEQVKEEIKKKGVSTPFDVLKDLAVKLTASLVM